MFNVREAFKLKDCTINTSWENQYDRKISKQGTDDRTISIFRPRSHTREKSNNATTQITKDKQLKSNLHNNIRCQTSSIRKRIQVLREVSEFPNLPVCCCFCLLQEAGTVLLLAGKHSAHSQSQHMCVVFQSQPTWEMLLEDPQFLCESCPQIV